MSTVRFNVSRMFAHIEPWDVSNSVANLGPRAGELTWANALRIAACFEAWLVSPLADAIDYIDSWARETGAWEHDEIEAWTPTEALALLVQNVASDMRELGSDDSGLEECAGVWADIINGDKPNNTGVIGSYWHDNARGDVHATGDVMGEVCS